ncbi:3'-5' exonuclease [Nodularia chucula]|uniref:3'-5' exonuclease n=1 Tax=Nodularia chucula TaxID=3093667 RepID=UPI0039C61C9D
MAFNRHIADKLKNDPVIPSGRVTINTAHGFGYSLLISYFQGNKLDISENKYNQIAKEVSAKIINSRSEYEHDHKILTIENLANKWVVPPPFFDELSHQGKAEIKQFTRIIREISQYAMRTLTPLNVDDIYKMIEYFGLETPANQSTLFWGIKGDEAEVVWLLGSNLLPFTYKCTQEWQTEQEMNLTYVALTRAKKSLYLVHYSYKGSKNELNHLLLDSLGGLELPDSDTQLS